MLVMSAFPGLSPVSGPGTVGWVKEELEGCASTASILVLITVAGRWHPRIQMKCGETLRIWCWPPFLLSLLVDSGLTLNVPTEQEEKEDRFHPLPRLRTDMASPGKLG